MDALCSLPFIFLVTICFVSLQRLGHNCFSCFHLINQKSNKPFFLFSSSVCEYYHNFSFVHFFLWICSRNFGWKPISFCGKISFDYPWFLSKISKSTSDVYSKMETVRESDDQMLIAWYWLTFFASIKVDDCV